jgi:cephalosporin hydroxylase
MKRVANLLGVTGALLAILSLVGEFARQSMIPLSLTKSKPVLVLSLAITLLLVAALIKLLNKLEAEHIIARDLRRFVWLSSIGLVGLFTVLFASYPRELSREQVIETFQRIYYNPERFQSTYLGVMSMQYPTDNWIMQEIISEVKPDFVIETGTAEGGTALFYATILEKVNENGKVITVDIEPHSPKVSEFKTWRERVEFIKGSSVSPEIVDSITKRVRGHKVLVTFDSNHATEHVLMELKLYSPLVSLNSYLVVQDTHLGGHPHRLVGMNDDEGPWVAVQAFLKTNKNFEIDHSREKHLITQNPSGFLKRIR